MNKPKNTGSRAYINQS